MGGVNDFLHCVLIKDGGKAGQVTPHPAKGKAASNGNNPKTPKSGGNFSCKSCER